MAYIDRPRERQWDQIEHAAPVPRLAVPFPEERRGSALVHELEVSGVGDVVPLQRESSDVGSKMWPLVVPSKWQRVFIGAERDAAARDLDPFVRGLAAIHHRLISLRTMLLIQWEAMPHVEQRLLVHRLVLEDRERGFRPVQKWIARKIGRAHV